MPRNDDGEFELVLGNRQLLSGFFIVVVLFGVFFTMGYIVGRHSAPETIADANTGSTAPATSPLTSAVSNTVASKPVQPSTRPGDVEVVPSSPVEERAVKTGTADSSGSPAVARSDPKPADPPKQDSSPARSEGGLAEPAAGEMYLQVAAPAPSAAEGVVAALQKKGYPTRIAPGPDASTVRVLVGPLASDQIRTTRTGLEEAGFKPFVRKY